jgi:hypothetical protein
VTEKTDEWNYVLNDGTGVPRQLTDMDGEVTMFVRYSPWGKPIETDGIGNFDASFIGTLIDATTGLIYIGNGQYYDPETGRFLTRGVNPNSANPYVPWNPIGILLGPLGMISANKARKKMKYAPALIITLLTLFMVACWALVAIAVGGLLLTSCSTGNPAQETESPSSATQSAEPATEPTVQPSPTVTPNPTPTEPAPCCNWLPNKFLITHYTIAVEDDPLFKGSYQATIPISEYPNGPVDYYNYQHNNAFIYGVPDPGTTSGFNYGVLQEGTGYTKDGKYITEDTNQKTANPETNDYGRSVFTYTKGGACAASGDYELEKDWTVAANLDYWDCGDKFKIEEFGDTIFEVTDTGSDLGQYHLDIFVGPMWKADFEKAYPTTYEYHRVEKQP